jgi:hypothetical protein
MGSAWLCLSPLAGCGSKADRPAPATFPVVGTLTLPVDLDPTNATIELVPIDGSKELSAMGIADGQGRFTLSVPYPDRPLPGAPEGPYRAVVMLPLQLDRSGGQRYELNQEFVVQPGENNFEVIVPGGKQ